jgi:hypothetical protein
MDNGVGVDIDAGELLRDEPHAASEPATTRPARWRTVAPRGQFQITTSPAAILNHNDYIGGAGTRAADSITVSIVIC